VCYLGETKRLRLTQKYETLVVQTHKAFAEQLPSKFKFYYLDEDNEMISINSQSDLNEALSIEDLSSLKLTVAGNLDEARNQLFKQISDTQSIRESLNQSQIFSVPNFSRASSIKPQEQEHCATERVRSIMKNIDSDFEDLEVSSAVVST